MPFETLNDMDWTALMEGLARGEYHLLLGAGASLGALGGDERSLPNAQTLAEELLANFGIETNGEVIDLGTAYEVVEGRLDAEERDRDQYLKIRFSDCQPSWHSIIPNICWRRIWTLNIDDVIEQTYAKNRGRYLQDPKTYNWTDPYREPDRERDELQIIHLHGFAPWLGRPGQDFVFSIIEYVQASSTRHAWHRIFGDEFLQRPFIVIGASLADEFDLALFLRRGNQSRELVGRPSIIVLRDITRLQREQFLKWGLVPVKADARAFFADLVKELPAEESKLVSLIPGRIIGLPPVEARIFQQQFLWLRADVLPGVPEVHDFYGGDDPTWADIIANRDARFEIVDRLLSDVLTENKGQPAKPRQVIHCLWGPPGCGKSTALLRIGRELITLGFDVFSFQGEERLDTKAALWWLQRSPKCALLFDGLADFTEDVGMLAQECAVADTNLVAFGTEREQRLQGVYWGIAPEFLKAGKDHRLARLSDGDIDLLLTVLERERRLGKLTRRSAKERRNYFQRDARRQLLPGMAELEGAKGFRTRLMDEYNSDIRSDVLRDVYALTCMSYALGYPLPLGIVCVAAGISARKLSQELSEGAQLAGIVRTERRGLRPRHRVVASIILERALNRKHRFRLSQDLAKALAPYITIDAIRQRTLPYRVARELMDADMVWAWMGKRLARDWYAQLVPEYAWNARFWEQRALVELRSSRFPQARSFAEQALALHEDPFTFNTSGTVLMRMATEYHEPGSARSNAVLWEAIAHLQESRELGEGKFAHPYITFFSYVLSYGQRAFKGKAVDARLSREWQLWMKDARQAQVFGYTSYYGQLMDFHKQWLQQAVSEA